MSPLALASLVIALGAPGEDPYALCPKVSGAASALCFTLRDGAPVAALGDDSFAVIDGDDDDVIEVYELSPRGGRRLARIAVTLEPDDPNGHFASSVDLVTLSAKGRIVTVGYRERIVDFKTDRERSVAHVFAVDADHPEIAPRALPKTAPLPAAQQQQQRVPSKRGSARPGSGGVVLVDGGHRAVIDHGLELEGDHSKQRPARCSGNGCVVVVDSGFAFSGCADCAIALVVAVTWPPSAAPAPAAAVPSVHVELDHTTTAAAAP